MKTKFLVAGLIGLFGMAASADQFSRPESLVPGAKPRRSCESLVSLKLPGAEVKSAVVVNDNAEAGSWCDVIASVTPATDENNEVLIRIGLPIERWNGRFFGAGGGGYKTSSPLRNLSMASMGYFDAVELGYAVGTTDGGGVKEETWDLALRHGNYALDPNGRLNWPAVQNFGYAAIHDMTVVGKALVGEFYGAAPQYSYFAGCSTGGRQGMMEAQRYPRDYQGIMSAAPPLYWPKIAMLELWGALVMQRENDFMPACKLNAATAAAVPACDALDGASDGVIADPKRCHFDAKKLVGKKIENCGVFDDKDARVVNAIWQGPRTRDNEFLWYGSSRAAPLLGLNPVAQEPPPVIMWVGEAWARYFLTQNPAWDWKTLTGESYEKLWRQSQQQYGDVLGTDNPDLSAFRDSGGKMLMWHGTDDQFIPVQGTMDYVGSVQQLMGGSGKVDDFLRFFVAPGVQHCYPGPSGVFDALMSWVERGHAPESLPLVKLDENKKAVRTRRLCLYPTVSVYRGGDVDKAESFACQLESKTDVSESAARN